MHPIIPELYIQLPVFILMMQKHVMIILFWNWKK